MDMDQRSLLIAATAACGMVMVVGAFVLLYRGAIKLEPPSNPQATELELFKILKLKTNIAALVLFVLGFAFLTLGFSYMSVEPPHFQIAGRVVGLSSDGTVSVSVCAGPWPVVVLTDGSINHEIKPDLERYTVLIGRAGRPLEQSIGVFRQTTRPGAPTYGWVPIGADRVARIGEIKLEGSAPGGPPAPIDHVTNKQAPSFNYASR